MRRSLILAALALVGCSEAALVEQDGPVQAVRPTGAPPQEPLSAAPAQPPPAPAPPGAPAAFELSREYTSLEGCRVLRSIPDEAGFSEELCPGLGGASLKRNEADGRQNLFVIDRNGREHSLNLPGTIGAGFSFLGPTVEWRGLQGRAGNLVPTALIVRYSVAERPDVPGPPTSYLAVATLLGERPCVIARVPPGPDQNVRARRIADAERGPCLAPPE